MGGKPGKGIGERGDRFGGKVREYKGGRDRGGGLLDAMEEEEQSVSQSCWGKVESEENTLTEGWTYIKEDSWMGEWVQLQVHKEVTE